MEAIKRAMTLFFVFPLGRYHMTPFFIFIDSRFFFFFNISTHGTHYCVHPRLSCLSKHFRFEVVDAHILSDVTATCLPRGVFLLKFFGFVLLLHKLFILNPCISEYMPSVFQQKLDVNKS